MSKNSGNKNAPRARKRTEHAVTDGAEVHRESGRNLMTAYSMALETAEMMDGDNIEGAETREMARVILSRVIGTLEEMPELVGAARALLNEAATDPAFDCTHESGILCSAALEAISAHNRQNSYQSRSS